MTVVPLLRYMHGLRLDFFEAAATLGEKEFRRDQGVSLGSYRNLFVHLAYVEEHHVTQFAEGRPTRWPPFDEQISTERYRSIDEVRQRIAEVTALAESKYRKWESPRALTQKVFWVRMGQPIRLTREEALAQCLCEHLLHLGEVEAMLWRRDVEPPTTLWIDRAILKGKPPAPPPVPVMRRIERLRRRQGGTAKRPKPRPRHRSR